jgi:3-oxoacyl-(acyl-carrier-protein) synthase
MSGCVQYSRRFYDEVLRDPTTASPLVFPETVFNAPASHLSAFLGSRAENYTLVGDCSAFIHGLELAAHWLTEGRVDGCLVVASEELDWLTADAFRHFSRNMVCAEGAGALYLGSTPTHTTTAELAQVTDGIPFSAECSAAEAIRQITQLLPPALTNELLVDGIRNARRFDGPETRAWSSWEGPRCSPKQILGEALTAAAAWQCVAACSQVSSGRLPAARVSVTGPNQQAIAARFLSLSATT